MGQVFSHLFGNRESNQDLQEAPWRKTNGWGKSARKRLKQEVDDTHPDSSLEITSFNILLAGQTSSGKSSFINSINSLTKEGVYGCRAAVGEKASSLTTEFCSYPMSPILPLTIYDTMGIDPDIIHTSDVNIDNILLAADGHVPDGYKFKPGEKLQHHSQGYNVEPTLADKAHCVAIVVDAQKVELMSTKMVEKLKSLADRLNDKKIPFVVLLTHMDDFCNEVKKDIKTMFRSTAVENLTTKISKMVHGLPESNIWPIINYKGQAELNDDMDVLLLYAIRQMLRACSDHLQDLKKQNPKNPVEAPFKYGQQEEGRSDDSQWGVASQLT